MRTSAKLWFATFSALVFSIGLLAGLILDRTWLLPPPETRGAPGGPGGGRGGPRGGFQDTSAGVAIANVNRLDRELHLSDDQRRDMVTLFETWDVRMRQTQDGVQEQFRADQQTLRQDVLKLLTAEQARRFAELGGRVFAPPPGRGDRPGGPPFGRPGRGPGR